MCGILGWITHGKPIELLACRDGSEAVAHCGPDGFGIVVGRTRTRGKS